MNEKSYQRSQQRNGLGNLTRELYQNRHQSAVSIYKTGKEITIVLRMQQLPASAMWCTELEVFHSQTALTIYRACIPTYLREWKTSKGCFSRSQLQGSNAYAVNITLHGVSSKILGQDLGSHPTDVLTCAREMSVKSLKWEGKEELRLSC